MLIYAVSLSAIILTIFGYLTAPSGRSLRTTTNQDGLGQIIAANVITNAACSNNLKINFNFNEAQSPSGQAVTIKVPQLVANVDVTPNHDLEQGHELATFALKIKELRFANARLLQEAGGIKTYHGSLVLATKSLSDGFAQDVSPKAVANVSVNIDSSGAMISCQQDESASAVCSRYGGIYNASGVPPCSQAPPNSSCKQGEVLVGVNAAGEPNCRSLNASCATGFYFAGFQDDGTIKCVTLPASLVTVVTKASPTPVVVNPTPTPTPNPDELIPLTPTTGVWTVVSHRVDDQCPQILGHDGGGLTQDGSGIEGRACYSIGYQCRERICHFAGEGYGVAFNGPSACGGVSPGLVSDKRLACVTGTPTRGPAARLVPAANLRIGDSLLNPTPEEFAAMPYCYPDFHCSYPGERCKVSGSGINTAGECVEFDPEDIGTIQLGSVVTVNQIPAMPCNPVFKADDPFGFKPNWCWTDPVDQATGVKACDIDLLGGLGSQNPTLDVGFPCEKTNRNICWRMVINQPSKYRVYKCEK